MLNMIADMDVSTHASVRRRQEGSWRQSHLWAVSTHASVRRRPRLSVLLCPSVTFQLTPP